VLICEKRWTPSFMRSYGALYLQYDPWAWWFEIVISARRVLLVVVAVYYPDDPIYFACSSFTVAAISLALQYKVKPFKMGTHTFTHTVIAAGTEVHRNVAPAATVEKKLDEHGLAVDGRALQKWERALAENEVIFVPRHTESWMQGEGKERTQQSTVVAEHYAVQHDGEKLEFEVPPETGGTTPELCVQITLDSTKLTTPKAQRESFDIDFGDLIPEHQEAMTWQVKVFGAVYGIALPFLMYKTVSQVAGAVGGTFFLIYLFNKLLMGLAASWQRTTTTKKCFIAFLFGVFSALIVGTIQAASAAAAATRTNCECKQGKCSPYPSCKANLGFCTSPSSQTCDGEADEGIVQFFALPFGIFLALYVFFNNRPKGYTDKHQRVTHPVRGKLL